MNNARLSKILNIQGHTVKLEYNDHPWNKKNSGSKYGCY